MGDCQWAARVGSDRRSRAKKREMRVSAQIWLEVLAKVGGTTTLVDIVLTAIWQAFKALSPRRLESKVRREAEAHRTAARRARSPALKAPSTESFNVRSSCMRRSSTHSLKGGRFVLESACIGSQARPPKPVALRTWAATSRWNSEMLRSPKHRSLVGQLPRDRLLTETDVRLLPYARTSKASDWKRCKAVVLAGLQERQPEVVAAPDAIERQFAPGRKRSFAQVAPNRKPSLSERSGRLKD